MGITAGAAILGSAVIGAGTSLYGANKAAGSAKDAANLQQQQYQQTRGDLSPYFGPGNAAVGNALSLAQSGPTGGGPDYVSLAAANMPGQMTQEQLEKTPGYQFTLNQGLKATQAAMAARGLGVSGASLKGAAEYATGLANKTYADQFNLQNQRFNDYLNLNTGQQGQLTNQFNRLNSIATLGANAAAGLGTQGTALANQAGGYINQAGLAQAAGVQGVGNAITSGINNYLAYDTMRNALASNGQLGGYNNGGFGNYTGPSNAANPQFDPMGNFRA